ncbi:MAG: BLUF domain-containing protein [Hyphomonas sp.]
MSNDLFRLIYVSTARPGLSEMDMSTLVNTSQSNNDERHITGYLVHNGENFMQLIEGARQEVADVFSRIVNDDRHSGVVRILAERADRRVFPDWSMNYFRVDPAEGNGWMLVRHDDPVDSLMPAHLPRELIYAFSKFIRQS